MIEELEKNDCSLEQSMELYERGVQLHRRMKEYLDTVEKRMTVEVVNQDGSRNSLKRR